LNRGNLRRRCEAKGTSRQGEADNSDAERVNDYDTAGVEV
jgi:hypothetical protein